MVKLDSFTNNTTDRLIRIVTWTLITFVVVGITGAVLLARAWGSTWDEAMGYECSGTVVSINKSSPCFNIIKVKEDTETVVMTGCYCGQNDETWAFLEEGDKVEKEAGEMDMKITKPDGTTQIFEFPYCAQ